MKKGVVELELELVPSLHESGALGTERRREHWSNNPYGSVNEH